MSSIFSSNTLIKLGSFAAASLVGLYVVYQAARTNLAAGDLLINESEYTKQRLLLLLEDLRMEYTPYYIHYYHALTAVHQDYGDRPRLVQQLTDKIKERLDSKVKEVHAELLKQYMIESEVKLHEWITHYMQDDPEIKRQVELIDKNNDLLFGGPKPQEPNFELEFPADLTKEKYLKMLKKIFAAMRYVLYKEIRTIVRNRQEKYMTKNEMKDILMNIDVQTIRAKVFQMYGLPEPSPRQPSHRILQKAHYTFMIDKEFMQKVREVKQSHERFMTAILGSDVFPSIEERDPLTTDEDDDIPVRFGSSWFEHDKEESKRSVDHDIEKAGGEIKFSQIVMQNDDKEIADLDSVIDLQKRLLFTETKMKAVNNPDEQKQEPKDEIGEEVFDM